jgi:hypothetical protein
MDPSRVGCRAGYHWTLAVAVELRKRSGVISPDFDVRQTFGGTILRRRTLRHGFNPER